MDALQRYTPEELAELSELRGVDLAADAVNDKLDAVELPELPPQHEHLSHIVADSRGLVLFVGAQPIDIRAEHIEAVEELCREWRKEYGGAR